MANTRLCFWYPIFNNDHDAKVKNASSKNNLTIPGVTTTVFPERLGSSATAKVPQRIASISGIPKPNLA